MNLDARIKKVEQAYLLKKDLFEDRPFADLTDAELIKLIKDNIEQIHREENISCLSESISYYNSLYKKNLLTGNELKTHIESEKQYWNGEFSQERVSAMEKWKSELSRSNK